MMWLLLSGLMALCIAMMAMRCVAQSVVAIILLFNWALNSLFCWLTGVNHPILWFLVTDYLCAILVLLSGRTVWQRLIIASYGIECIIHAAYGWVGPSIYADYYHYYSLLTVAWGQILIVGLWGVYDRCRNIGGIWRVPTFLSGLLRRHP
jgi:hypothetical protein